jgi:hypothetical protein
MSQNQKDKVRLQATERLKTIVNALKHSIIDNDNSVLTINRKAKLKAECVKHALDEILCGAQAQDSSSFLAYVILDESGNLFSRSDLVERLRNAPQWLVCSRCKPSYRVRSVAH